jgi:hypothetical protein
MAYAYQADIYCDRCGQAIKRELDAKGQTPDGADEDAFEDTFDSDDYPKWADEDEGTDSPQHCGAGEECKNAIDLAGRKIGALIGSNLTRDGIEYVLETLAEPNRSRYQRALGALWAETYGITYAVRFTAYNGISYELDDRLSLDGARQTAADAIRAARKEGRVINVQERGIAFEIEEREDAVSIDDASGFLRIVIEVRA